MIHSKLIQMSDLVFKYLMHLLVWRIKQTKIIANSKNKTSVMQKHRSKMHKQSSDKAKVKDILQKGKKEKKKGKERKKTKK